MNLTEIIKLESCVIDMKAKNKEEALRKIAALLKRSIENPEVDEEMIYQGLCFALAMRLSCAKLLLYFWLSYLLRRIRV
ncbi:MAG TPA: hypothetical protein GXX77_08040 [Candidatus Cloacimonetes bacterium]|nr:hypothetical protein [Candidatus Cloacimonadota bacterium]